ncbi:glucuronyl hydrolase [Pedobacter changchengzhani]|uniref:Glucuronyl hydrolase n=2 Tax=Pedobacter changchengzhani TaxID=2529274 RepID=A0A4R5MKT7_9SPHI|nr:glucuronyl hydrolase [Pedobacter changchengzhani]
MLLVALVFLISGCATKKITQNQTVLSTINQNFEDGKLQYEHMMTLLPKPDRFPQSYAKGKMITIPSGDWVSGFYPGSLLFLYKETGEQKLLTEARRIMVPLSKEQFNNTNHDVGFMLYDSFGNALKIDPKAGDKEVLINAAKSLSSRFSEKVGSIKSWDSKNPDDFLVIIDNMMNLELLFWATKETGDSSYYKIAVAHANTAMKNHFRPDYSSYHVVNYNPKTGEVVQKRTAQGYSDSSAWARGQAWGLYGYTMVYRETKDKKYLDQANHIAEFMLNNPNMPKDYIPYWDFNAPNIPNAYRDASAAAVMASGLLELYKYNTGAKAKKYYTVAETVIKNLSSPTYKAEIGTNGGFILKHSVGHFPGNGQVDVPLTYADYYFIEAMMRYKN